MFSRKSSVIETPFGLGSNYSGVCADCGKPREFTFRLPDEPIEIDNESDRFGGDGQSELLDPGEWMFVADRYAGAAPEIVPATSADRSEARKLLTTALSAVTETIAFVDPQTNEIPPRAFRSELGRQMLAREPGRFSLIRLETVQTAYRDLLIEVGGHTD